MKAFFLLILLTGTGLVFTGCESDLPPSSDTTQNRFERGISGHGTLTTPSNADDTFSSDTSNGGH